MPAPSFVGDSWRTEHHIVRFRQTRLTMQRAWPDVPRHPSWPFDRDDRTRAQGVPTRRSQRMDALSGRREDARDFARGSLFGSDVPFGGTSHDSAGSAFGCTTTYRRDTSNPAFRSVDS